MKIELFSGLIDFHNVTNLVWYVKHCKVEIVTTLQENLDSTSAVQVFLHAQEKHSTSFALTSNTLNQYKSWRVMPPVSKHGKEGNARKHGKEGTCNCHDISVPQKILPIMLQLCSF